MGLRLLLENDLTNFDFNSNLTTIEPWASYCCNHIDLPRIREGRLGGQVFRQAIIWLFVHKWNHEFFVVSSGQPLLDAILSSRMPSSSLSSKSMSLKGWWQPIQMIWHSSQLPKVKRKNKPEVVKNLSTVFFKESKRHSPKRKWPAWSAWSPDMGSEAILVFFVWCTSSVFATWH